uniref:Uncharacterized protein n=1 Tax=Avena sativa TaxID=4498 RepID=A0ACD5TA76_AVESA
MAALLRHGAARRLGGSMVRRAEAVVADGRRRLGARLIHTEEQAHAELALEVQQKKEELYDVIAKGEEIFWTSSFRNKLLLQHLAVQVKARPEDSKWRRMRFYRKANTLLDTMGLIALTSSIATYVVR